MTTWDVRPNWLDGARQLPVAAVAEALGLEQGKPVSGRPTFACPACGAPTRHTKRKDRRGAVGLTPDAMGWRCFQCEIGGDAIDLASATLGRARFRDLARPDQEHIRTWFQERWPGLFPDGHGPVGRGKLVFRPQARPVRRSEPPPRYPPTAELEAFWGAAMPVDADPEVAKYLKGRSLEPSDMAVLDLARALPKNVRLPRWAWGPEGAWMTTGHRLLSPLYDASGGLRSLKARYVGEGKPKRKSLNPAGGFQVRGLVLACPLALQLLELGRLPDWWDGDVSFRLVLAEGEVDFWTWVTGSEAFEDLGHGPAVVGLFNGLLPCQVVSKIPKRTTVVISEHQDDPGPDGRGAGEKYTEQILKALAPSKDKLQAEVWKP